MRFMRSMVYGAGATAAVLLPAAALAGDLIKVYEQAQVNDATFLASAHARDAAVEARPQALGVLLPQVNGQYQFGRTTTDLTLEPSDTGCVASPDPLNPNATPCEFTTESDDDQLSLTLTQALFDWPAIQAFRQSGDQVALAETGYRSSQQNLILRVATAYFNVLAAEDTLRSSNAENKAVERQLEQAKKRFEVGLSAITDVQEAQARYDLTVAQQIEAQQALDSAREALAEITGAHLSSLATLKEDIPLPAPQPGNVTSWVTAAADGNLDLLSARLNADIAAKAVNAAWGRHLPTVSGQAQYAEGTQGGRFPQDYEQESVGLVVNVPIFAGLRTQSLVRQATAVREQRRQELEASRRLVERQTRDAYQGVIAGASRVKALKQAVLSSTTALEASETGLQVGARTAVDVLNAQQQLYFAQRNYLRSRYDYLLSVLRLKAAAGRLNPPDLIEVDRLLVEG